MSELYIKKYRFSLLKYTYKFEIFELNFSIFPLITSFISRIIMELSLNSNEFILGIKIILLFKKYNMPIALIY
jgi:hypothetical protein